MHATVVYARPCVGYSRARVVAGRGEGRGAWGMKRASRAVEADTNQMERLDLVADGSDNMIEILQAAASSTPAAVREERKRSEQWWATQLQERARYLGNLNHVQTPMVARTNLLSHHVRGLHADSPQPHLMLQHLLLLRHSLPQEQVLQVKLQPFDHAVVGKASAALRDTDSSNRRTDVPFSRPWSQQELESLAVLVCQDGPGNWGDKALLLGTGRTAASTGSAWRRYERQVKDGTREPLANLPPMARPCLTARMGSTVGYKLSAAPGAGSPDVPLGSNCTDPIVLPQYSLSKAAHERLLGVWPVPAFVQLTFDAPGPTGISWCCREITPVSTGDRSPLEPFEKKQEQAHQWQQQVTEPREKRQKQDIAGVGEVSHPNTCNQTHSVATHDIFGRHMPPRPWSTVRKAGNVNDCSGNCVALIESVEPGSAADALVSTLPAVERALLLREGADVCLEAINGQSVHTAEQSYKTTLRSLRLMRRPVTMLLRTHAIGTEPTLLKTLSKLPISTLQRLQPQLDGDARSPAVLAEATVSAAKAAVNEEAESQTEAEDQKQNQEDGDSDGDEYADNDLRWPWQTQARARLRRQCSGDITTDDEGYMSDAGSVADSSDCSPSSPSPTPTIAEQEELLLECTLSSAPLLFSRLPAVIVADKAGKPWPAEWEACIQVPCEGEADDHGDSMRDNMTDEEDGEGQTVAEPTPRLCDVRANIEHRPAVLVDGVAPFPILDANGKWLSTCKFELEQVVGKTLKILQGPATEKEQLSTLMRGVIERSAVQVTLTNYDATKKPFRNALTVEPVEVNGRECFLATSVTTWLCDI